MRRADLELKVREVLDALLAQQPRPTEDGFVELKSEWIPPEKAARQLGGSANAARGEPVLWIVGADESRHTVPGAQENELASWWPQVQKHFDEVSPDLQEHLNITFKDTTVVALLFATDRAPFVTKSDKGRLEVSWRTGNRTIDARRQDLLRVLVPASRMPAIECLKGAARASYTPGHRSEVTADFEAKMSLYLTPASADPVFLPFHRMAFGIVLQGGGRVNLDDVEAFSIQNSATPSIHTLVTTSSTEVTFKGPGPIDLHGKATVSSKVRSEACSLYFVARPIGSDRVLRIEVPLSSAGSGGNDSYVSTEEWDYAAPLPLLPGTMFSPQAPQGDE